MPGTYVCGHLMTAHMCPGCHDLGTCRARCKNYNDRARACSFEKGVLEGHREFEKGVLERRLDILRGRKIDVGLGARGCYVVLTTHTQQPQEPQL